MAQDLQAAAWSATPAPLPASAAGGEAVTLAQSLIADSGWSAANFHAEGPNPPYLRIGGRLWLTLGAYEPCFTSAIRDRILLRSKVPVARHFETYDELMVEPFAFEESFGPGEGTDAVFPFGAWLTIGAVGFEGVELRGRRAGQVVLPLAPLAVASGIWLRRCRRSA